MFLREAARMLAGIDSSIEREVYAGRAAKMAGVTAEAMNDRGAARAGDPAASGNSARRSGGRSARRSAWRSPRTGTLAYTDVKSAKAEENVLRLLFSDQKLIAGLEEIRCRRRGFPRPCCVRFTSACSRSTGAGQIVDILSFEGWLEPNEMSLLSSILGQGIPPRRAPAGAGANT